MDGLFRFADAVPRDPAVDAWLQQVRPELAAIARQWVGAMRTRGADVRELLHDGHPTACVRDAAFAYVDAFQAHVNVGFYRGADLPDPTGMLAGKGRSMRHVKLRPGHDVDEVALLALLDAAYDDMTRRLP